MTTYGPYELPQGDRFISTTIEVNEFVLSIHHLWIGQKDTTTKALTHAPIERLWEDNEKHQKSYTFLLSDLVEIREFAHGKRQRVEFVTKNATYRFSHFWQVPLEKIRELWNDHLIMQTCLSMAGKEELDKANADIEDYKALVKELTQSNKDLYDIVSHVH